jgi:ATP-binding cassette subfamily B protein
MFGRSRGRAHLPRRFPHRRSDTAPPERGAPRVLAGDELPEEEHEGLKEVMDGEPVRAVIDCDLRFSGQYGHSHLVLGDRRLALVENGRIHVSVDLSDVATAYCKDYVGNALLEVRLKDDRRIEVARYSKTMAEAGQQLAERINRTLNVSDEEIEAETEQASKISGPKEDKPTYRCPNCGHPLTGPSDACPKCVKTREVLWRLAKLCAHHKRVAVAGAVLSILFIAANLGPGVLVRELVDGALQPGQAAAAAVAGVTAPDAAPASAGAAAAAPWPDLDSRLRQLYAVCGIFLMLVTARAVLHALRIRVLGTLGNQVVRDLRDRLYRTLQRLSLSYYDREHTGRIMSRVLQDTAAVRMLVVQASQQVVTDLLMLVGIAVVLFLINWRLAAIALLPVPIVAVLVRAFARRFRGIYRTVRRRFATLSASVAETITGMRVVKSFAQEDREISGFAGKNENVYAASMAAVATSSRFQPVTGLIMSLGVVAVWLIGGRSVLHHAVSLGVLLLFITYMNQFYMPVTRLMHMTQVFQDSATAAERIFSIMDMPSDVADHDGAVEPEKIEGRIQVQGVTFAYEDGEKVLKDIDIDVRPGEMIGLVGHTGSGKSTLISLICRFYDPDKGRILLDGRDLRDIRARALRSRIGMVLQEPFLFAGTIKENIAYGRPDATEAEIIQAARAANAHEFIMNLPDGYDSDAGERGVMLSGGEKQRISIARAILKNPAILILDEATSAVDTVTEKQIQEAIDHLVHGRTTIAIAHRLSTLRNADRLIVLEDGAIIEQGTHRELMQKDGVYAELVHTQAEFAEQIAAAGEDEDVE